MTTGGDTQPTYLPDTDQACRECGGQGVTREKTERGTVLATYCWRCGGSGANSVKIGHRS